MKLWGRGCPSDGGGKVRKRDGRHVEHRHVHHHRIVARPDQRLAFVGERALALTSERDWLRPVDAVLSTMSWDETAAQMKALIAEAAEERQAARPLDRTKPHYDVLVVGAGTMGGVGELEPEELEGKSPPRSD